ncbi:MAG: fatty acid desaturase [Pseudomonadota bacterium]
MQYEGVPTPGQQEIPNGQNLFKIAVLFSLLFGAFFAGHYGAVILQHELVGAGWAVMVAKWGWLLLCGSLASVAAQGLGVLAHDAVHKVLLKRLWLNELVGGIISAFSLLPFNANRQFHLAHHRFSHQRGLDPEQPLHNHNLLFAISAGSLIGLFLQYRILLVNLFTRLFERRYAAIVLKDMVYLSIAMGSYFLLIPLTGMVLEHTLLPMLLTLPLFFGVRAISDHYGLPAIVREKESDEGDGSRESIQVQQEVGGWVILTSPLLEWLWSNVNYHEVHHKFPYLSHRYLKQAFAATHGQLPYVVADGYLRNLWRHRQRDYYHG